MSLALQTLHDILFTSGRDFAQRTALAMVNGSEVTYAQLLERSQLLGAFLRERGISFGDRVAILGENMPNWGIAYFAVTSMGAVAVPILPDFHTSDVARIIEHSGSSAILVSRRFFEKVEGLPSHVKKTLILLDDLTVVPPDASASELQRDQMKRTAAIPSLDSNERFAVESTSSLREDDLATIVYTSGTTGHSKGVMLTHGNLVSDAKATVTISGIRGDDRLLSILPLPHTYECTLGLITPVLVGASVSYLDKPPTAPVLLPALATVQPTIMLSVPLIIEKIYKAKILPQLTASPLLRRLYARPFFRRLLNRVAGKKLLKIFGGRLRLFTIGGAPLAPDVELFLREAHFPYAIGYGLTETAPLVAGTGSRDTRYRSTGPALPGTQIRIANPNLQNGEGEIQIKGPTVMRGYYNDPERTRDTFTEDGWLKTGDLGVFASDGYLFIKGRLKNMILGPSGKNIYPEEIEAIINEFDTVRESVVFEQGNRLVALVHLDYERLQKLLHSLSETDVRTRVNAMLSDLHAQINNRVPLYARIHRIIEQAEPFQKTPTQKIKRHLYVS